MMKIYFKNFKYFLYKKKFAPSRTIIKLYLKKRKKGKILLLFNFFFFNEILF